VEVLACAPEQAERPDLDAGQKPPVSSLLVLLLIDGHSLSNRFEGGLLVSSPTFKTLFIPRSVFFFSPSLSPFFLSENLSQTPKA